MGFCPVPHTFRDQVWLCVGAAVGLSAGYLAVRRLYSSKSSTLKSRSPIVIQDASRVLETSERFIDEYVGVPSTKDSQISFAKVVVKSECGEIPQTPAFDELLYVLKGVILVSCQAPFSGKGKALSQNIELKATQGEILSLPKGFRYTISFPDSCEYIAVCLPAFTPALAGR
uniref:Uncharacterized protein n=1 Tax=Timspurckia oligopyrenoides TaxID=708627 RepID=A0A7S0ZGG0_9RHOD|mmetsp:Transcript_4087/g.7182  ORF Transcript_4087/g.7182 Transcript_4087/m.7182 type:complete len:172 (+) Transcript_4087:48-563(+)